MKILAVATALMLSGAAFAQATPPPEPMAPAMPAPETPPTGEMPATPAEPAMPAPAAPAAQAMPPMAAAPAPMAQAEYPRCSRTVVDQCIQSSARESDTKGGPPARRKARRR